MNMINEFLHSTELNGAQQLVLTVIIPTVISSIIGIISFVISRRYAEKDRIPRLIIEHSDKGYVYTDNGYCERDTNIDCELGTYYKMQKKFDNDMKKYVKDKGYKKDFNQKLLLEKIMTNSRIPVKYIRDSLTEKDNEVNEIIWRFYGDNQFMDKLNKYKEYNDYAKWTVKIRNAGNSDAYNFRIHIPEKNKIGSKGINERILRKDEIAYVSFHLLDKTAICEKKGNLHQLSWKNKRRMEFYLSRKKFSIFHEKLFMILYKDCYGKEHEINCYAKVNNNSKNMICN